MEEKFQIQAPYKPAGDQPQAIEKLVAGLNAGSKNQVLLGVTGSGKTFTMANIIQKVQRPTLVISHNKTLAAQLFQEFREFFPKNAIEYFVSYYDYYQPEAYLPQTDTYIEKETEINEEIDKLRLSATTSLLTRKDVLVVASVSCIYNLGSPVEYGKTIIELQRGQKISREEILKQLIKLYYQRNDYELARSCFRVHGENIELIPSYKEYALRLEINDSILGKISIVNPLTGKSEEALENCVIYPAKHYITSDERFSSALTQIETDLKKRVEELKKQDQLLEAERLSQKTNYDLEAIREFGYCNGIENYSRYFDGRAPGDPPFTLLDYFPKDYLLIIDESHQTLPQIRGMYNGDKARKEVLVDFGFRLPSAFDNRPLKFNEFLPRINQVIYASATPNDYEVAISDQIVEQLVRPTGLLDPKITVKPTKGQIDDLIKEIEKRIARKERVLVTTLTKRMAEDLSEYLDEQKIKVTYLHSEIETLDRSDILDSLRLGNYDVLVGINLLREGLDLPEVSLVVILDADKEGFLRSQTSLIQVMGRAARHISGEVIMYADVLTGSMQRAIEEIERRRKIQLDHNQKNNIRPQSVKKPIRSKLIEREEKQDKTHRWYPEDTVILSAVEKAQKGQLLAEDRQKLVKILRREMQKAARELNFEQAAEIRDQIKLIEN